LRSASAKRKAAPQPFRRTFVNLPAVILLSAAFIPGQASVASADEVQTQEFVRHMLKLEREHKLAAFVRYDSKRFTALSNAGDGFTVQRLRQCEVMYDQFYRHFRRKGFTLQAPAQKLMLAVFDSPAGFDAYLGRKTSTTLTGVYHPISNRLVLYDLGRNRQLLAERDQALKQRRKIASDLHRSRYTETVERVIQDAAREATVGTTMHEVAHQLSFNCGLLNRAGDVPLWLAEGLACYCEATEQGDWQALGAPNPLRIGDLQKALAGRGQLIPFRTLLTSDAWRDDGRALLGYAQSWALFRLLMQERPKALHNYLTSIHPRRTPDRRLTDFAEAFGADLASLERRYLQSLRDLVHNYGTPVSR
jgi:hypothetical protein